VELEQGSRAEAACGLRCKEGTRSARLTPAWCVLLGQTLELALTERHPENPVLRLICESRGSHLGAIYGNSEILELPDQIFRPESLGDGVGPNGVFTTAEADEVVERPFPVTLASAG